MATPPAFLILETTMSILYDFLAGIGFLIGGIALFIFGAWAAEVLFNGISKLPRPAARLIGLILILMSVAVVIWGLIAMGRDLRAGG